MKKLTQEQVAKDSLVFTYIMCKAINQLEKNGEDIEKVAEKCSKKIELVLWVLTHKKKAKLSEEEIEFLEDWVKTQEEITERARQITYQQIKGFKEMCVGYLKYKQKTQTEIEKFCKIFDKLMIFGLENIQRLVLTLETFKEVTTFFEAQTDLLIAKGDRFE